MLASLCLAGSGVVCSLISNNSSEEHLAVSFTLLTTRPQLLLLILPFRISLLPSSMPCKSLLKKLYVHLPSILILLLTLPLTQTLTLSLSPTRLGLTLTALTPLSLLPFTRNNLLKFVPLTTLLHFRTLCLIYMYICIRLTACIHMCLPTPIFFI